MRIILLSMLLLIYSTSFSQTTSCPTSITDQRDQHTYTAVQIGNQCWMVENMNIGQQTDNHQQSDNNSLEKTCWGNDPENCDVFGGLYTWDEAMQYSQKEGAQGICPKGWHIPTKDEWQQLMFFLGEKQSGTHMKVTKNHDPAWDGDNTSGFTALPAGGGYGPYFHRLHSWALFWSSTDNGDNRAWFTQLDNFWYPAPPKYPNLFIGNYYQKFNGFSVRCIQNTVN